jgi:WD40-like Beta Propeller Repeat
MKKVMGLFICTIGLSGCLTFDDLPGVTLACEHDITIDFENRSLQPSTAAPAIAQSPPDTEIFLASLSSVDGKLAIGPPNNISNSPGYDNQPSFTPDGQGVLFASIRGQAARPALSAVEGAASGAASVPSALLQTDIYRYEIASRRIWRVTHTPEGEYSPTVMPDGKHISVVRVEADGTQRLWRVLDNGPKSESSVILADIKPVGYHAWIDERTVALFVLGEREQPATLQVAHTGTGKAELVTTNIGRSLQRMPSGAISFVQREPASGAGAPGAMINELLNAKAAERGAISTAPLIRPAAGAIDPFLAWTPDGTALMAANSIVYRWRIGEPDWTVVANLEAFGLGEVSRLAVSPKGDQLALVARTK